MSELRSRTSNKVYFRYHIKYIANRVVMLLLYISIIFKFKNRLRLRFYFIFVALFLCVRPKLIYCPGPGVALNICIHKSLFCNFIVLGVFFAVYRKQCRLYYSATGFVYQINRDLANTLR